MWVRWDLQAHRDLQVTLVLPVHLRQVSFDCCVHLMLLKKDICRESIVTVTD